MIQTTERSFSKSSANWVVVWIHGHKGYEKLLRTLPHAYWIDRIPTRASLCLPSNLSVCSWHVCSGSVMIVSTEENCSNPYRGFVMIALWGEITLGRFEWVGMRRWFRLLTVWCWREMFDRFDSSRIPSYLSWRLYLDISLQNPQYSHLYVWIPGILNSLVLMWEMIRLSSKTLELPTIRSGR